MRHVLPLKKTSGVSGASAKIYPYPATLNVGDFVSIKLTQTNFLLWKTQILGLVEIQEMPGFLDGSVHVPSPAITTVSAADSVAHEITIPDYLAWKKSYRLLRGWITGTLSDEVLALVVGIDTTLEVWKTFEDSYT